MRIGFDAKRLFHNFRGLGNYGRTVVEGLEKFHPEHKYILYTPQFKDPKALEWRNKMSQLEVVTPQGPIMRYAPALWRSLYLGERAKKDSVDIYHGLTAELPLEVRGQNFKTIVTIHDLIFLRFPHFFPWMDRQVYLKKITYACNHADVIVAICQQTKNDLMEFLQIPDQRIRIIYQSAHPRYYSPPDKEKIAETLTHYNLPSPYLLYVGAMEGRKNIMSLVKAFHAVADKIDHCLVLVGQGREYGRQIMDYVDSKKLLSRVKWLEDVPNYHLPALYSGCELFCYPSHFEGFGLPVIEALFCNRPVITSQGSCFPESAGDDQVYIDPLKPEELANAIVEVLNDSDRMETMARLGRQHVERFHWRETSKNLTGLYQEIGS